MLYPNIELLHTSRLFHSTFWRILQTEWVLQAWHSNDPAPKEPEKGRFIGRSGCNRYSASVKDGDMPGDVSVGQSISTRMACPENIMAVETRFLQQLSHVKKYGFFVTKLALTYEKDGVWKTMLLNKR